MSATVTIARKEQSVGMGQIAVVEGQEMAREVLGSCIGLVIFDDQKSLGALAHIILPSSSGKSAAPGKFVDTAIVWMVEELTKHGANPRRLHAKMAGGSNMFAAAGPFQIGQENAEATRRLLEKMKIRLLAENLGGKQGRRVCFEPHSYTLKVEVAGQATVTL